MSVGLGRSTVLSKGRHQKCFLNPTFLRRGGVCICNLGVEQHQSDGHYVAEFIVLGSKTRPNSYRVLCEFR